MTAALDRAVANAMGLKSVHNCEKWAGLTDEEIQDCYKAAYKVVQGRRLEVTFARAIKAKLKELNT